MTQLAVSSYRDIVEMQISKVRESLKWSDHDCRIPDYCSICGTADYGTDKEVVDMYIKAVQANVIEKEYVI